MSLNHLLPLSTLHAAAPGVLDVVFGPDGEFEGAPPWYGPVHLLDGKSRPIYGFTGTGRVLVAGMGSEAMEDCALDLRIPTVAARLAGLCARAMGHHQPATWSIQGERGSVFALVGVTHTPRTSFNSTIVLRWDRGRAMGYGSGGDAQHPSITTTATEGAEFLRDLVLALAPKIAALKT